MTEAVVETRGPRRPAILAALALGAALLFVGLILLGNWQLRRLAWKRELIAHVAERAHAPAVPLPPRSAWPGVTAASDEYRHVRLSGRFVHAQQTLVQASTELGSGFWVITPLRLANDGGTVLVNRGFVPEAMRRVEAGAAESEQSLSGLLRISEPAGFWPRRNDAAAGRWFSREVPAIAAARGLADVAPFFVDADAGTDAQAWPRGGLTVLVFQDRHLGYALTWYGLAALLLLGAAIVAREERRLRTRSRRS
ncbi:MAG: SURF1 family protein [Burkholderiaceae bacterium]